MPKIITMGELLIDFIPDKKDCKLKDVNKFRKAAGGAPANVAVALARVGISAAFIGKVGADAFGDFLLETMSEQQVDTTNIVRTEEAMTTLAFVSLTGKGERDFAFYRKPGADMLLEAKEVDFSYFKSASIFHFGTISLTDEPVRSTTYYLLEEAKNNDMFISLDPNIRPPLWNNQMDRLQVQFEKALPYVDLLKLNYEELLELSDYNFNSGTPKLEEVTYEFLQKICQSFLVQGPSFLIITAGSRGSYFVSKDEVIFVPTLSIKTVDTTGAGDAFMAGLLSEIVEKLSEHELADIDWKEVLITANKFGAIASSRYGAIPSLPSRAEINEF